MNLADIHEQVSNLGKKLGLELAQVAYGRLSFKDAQDWVQSQIARCEDLEMAYEQKQNAQFQSPPSDEL